MQVGLWSHLLFRKFDLGYLAWVHLGKEGGLKGSLMSSGVQKIEREEHQDCKTESV